jgi:outer membrane protein assembly factor BamE (lipoprotein component of BamABCDE complex)
MRPKLSLAALALLLCLCRLSTAYAAEDPKPAAAAPVQSIDSQVLAKVVPGISKAQVKSLLGAPWRTVQYNDEEEIENEFWEYRGKDSHGTYRVHIEFDKHDIVVIVGKIPDKVAGGKGTPAKS